MLTRQLLSLFNCFLTKFETVVDTSFEADSKRTWDFLDNWSRTRTPAVRVMRSDKDTDSEKHMSVHLGHVVGLGHAFEHDFG